MEYLFKFNTLIRGGIKENDKDAFGYILGLMDGMCTFKHMDNPYSSCVHFNDDALAMTRCTEREYFEFTKVIEDIYPGVCRFYYFRPTTELNK